MASSFYIGWISSPEWEYFIYALGDKEGVYNNFKLRVVYAKEISKFGCSISSYFKELW